MALPRETFLLVASALLGCGRTPLEELATADNGQPSTPGTASAPLACSDLKPLADRGLLLSAHTKEAYFTRDRSHVVLRVSAGILDRLVRIDFPSGKTTNISDDLVYWTQSLGTDGNLLVDYRSNDGNDPLYVYEGRSLRLLAKGLGSTHASPDGQHLYAVAFDKNGVLLKAIDVASGSARILAPHAENEDIALSPSGSWLAYRVAGTMGLVNVSNGAGYIVASLPGARDPFFVTDDLLIFSVGQCEYQSCDIRGHHVGNGDDSYVIVSGERPGPSGYQISSDKSHILTVSRESRWLSSHTLDGQEHALLSTNLYSSSDGSLPGATRLFAFEAQRPRAIYETAGDSYTETGDRSHAVTVSLTEQGPPLKLAENATFLPAPSTSSVMVFEEHAGGTQRLRLVGIDSGFDKLTYTAAGGIGAVTAIRDDQALLFVDLMTSGHSHLRFLSNNDPDSVVLGEWSTSEIETLYPPETRPRGSYPVDPTGCFTIVDSDLPPNPGTRLVVLPE